MSWIEDLVEDQDHHGPDLDSPLFLVTTFCQTKAKHVRNNDTINVVQQCPHWEPEEGHSSSRGVAQK